MANADQRKMLSEVNSSTKMIVNKVSTIPQSKPISKTNLNSHAASQLKLPISGMFFFELIL
jgi:predicted RNA-binding protein with PIN domain